MVEHMWTILCRGASVDRESNNISLFEVVEQLAVASDAEVAEAPITTVGVGLFVLVSTWTRSDLEVGCRARSQVDIESPSGTTMGGGSYDIDLTVHPRSRAMTRMIGFPATHPGYHWINISLQQEGEDQFQRVARIPVQVDLPAVPHAEANGAVDPS